MLKPLSLAYFLLALAVFHSAAAEETDTGLTCPGGFEITLFAGDDLAHDIYAMTHDRHGRVVVAGPGYIKTLHDENNDGRADRATLFSEFPKRGAQGLLFLGDDLLCTGDNGLWLLRDKDGNGRADGVPEKWATLAYNEHGAHGIRQGPEGAIYVVCGNNAGVTKDHITSDRSPVKSPDGGVVLRFSPDGKEAEVFAHGFRNAYDIAFNPAGNLFLVDSDGEREQHLPWYAPTRLFDVAAGRHHGWLVHSGSQCWNRPPEFFDSVPRLAEMGRGSPTGIECYRHTQFPAKYRGGLFSCCWSLGRVYHLPLTPSGASYTAEVETFIEAKGNNGFAPSDLSVGPKGDLFIAMGGRHTKGSVFRVRYAGEADGSKEQDEKPSDLDKVLRAHQPLSAWSRVQWEPMARKLGRQTFLDTAKNENLTDEQRVRAIEILVELFEGLAKPDELISAPAVVAARAAWATRREANPKQRAETLSLFTYVQVPEVKRSAWEGLALEVAEDHAHWSDLAHSDSSVRNACLLAHSAIFLDIGTRYLGIRSTGAHHYWQRHMRDDLKLEHFADCIARFLSVEAPSEKLEFLRLAQLCLHDVRTDPARTDMPAGYSLNAPAIQIADARDYAEKHLIAAWPTEDQIVNRELSRLLAMLQVEDAELVERMAGIFTEKSVVTDDIHYLIVLGQLPGKRSEAARRKISGGIAGVHQKMKAENRHASRFWPVTVLGAVKQLMKRDDQLAAALIEDAAFNLPEQAMLAEILPSAEKEAATRKLVHFVIHEEKEWSLELVSLAAQLPQAEALPALRNAADSIEQGAAISHLARFAQAEDRELFIAGLQSAQGSVIEKSAVALTNMKGDPSDVEWLAAISSLKTACQNPPQKSVRQRLAALLKHWSGKRFEIKEDEKQLAKSYQPWFDWFAAEHAELAKRLQQADADWSERLANIDWSAGDINRGRAFFESKSCHQCHAGNNRLGPELSPAVKRFSREDLLAAVYDPNREVAPPYHTTRLETASGKLYHGIIIYESPDATLLQTEPEKTIRIAGETILSSRKSPVSLMPAGLLNGATDQNIADLYRYLITLPEK